MKLIDVDALDSGLLCDGLANALIGYPHRRKLTIGEIRGILQRAPAVDAIPVVRCKDCRLKDTQLCRASKSIKYDLRRDKHTYKTFMEPDGFCSIGERGAVKEGR